MSATKLRGRARHETTRSHSVITASNIACVSGAPVPPHRAANCVTVLCCSVRFDKQALAVMAQFSYGLVDIGVRQVRRALAEGGRHSRIPARSEFLERADVQVPVVEIFLQRRHPAGEEAPILADAV